MDIIGFLYLVFMLSPLLIVSHFTLGSILNSDPKGVIYLLGLVLTCIVVVSCGTLLPATNVDNITLTTCEQFGFNYKNMPLGIVILSFTYLYLMLIIFKMDATSYYAYNLPTIVLFPVLIVAYIACIQYKKCSNWGAIGASLVLGSIGGGIWFAFVKSTGYKDLALFNGISNAAICKKPSKARFTCTTTSK